MNTFLVECFENETLCFSEFIEAPDLRAARRVVEDHAKAAGFTPDRVAYRIFRPDNLEKMREGRRGIENLEIATWWLPKLLGFAGPNLQFSEEGLTWSENQGKSASKLSLGEIRNASVNRGLLWSEIAIGTQGDDSVSQTTSELSEVRFGGFNKVGAKQFADKICSAIATERLGKLTRQIDEALRTWHWPASKDQFLTHPTFQRWMEATTPLATELRSILSDKPHEEVLVRRAKEIVGYWSEKEFAREKRNDRWCISQRDRHAVFFAKRMGYPLNDEQIRAIVRDEHRSLVVAGAGTGKTSTIVAKVLWILNERLSSVSRIRCLAFNKKAAEEINERLSSSSQIRSLSSKGKQSAEISEGPIPQPDQGPIASTFHSLGLKLAAQARGHKPRLTKLGEDDRLLQAFLRGCIDTGLKVPVVEKKVIEFLAFFRYPDPKAVPIEGLHEANRWAEGHNIRSLTGVKLRSNSEAIIANWLTLNGIPWEYETNYPQDTATLRHGQYRPDFFLPDHKVYIEHWACSRSGDLPSNWNEQEKETYREGMLWKCALHQRQKTKFLQTYSDINGRHTIIRDLENGLRTMGIYPIPLGEENRNKLVNNDEVIDPVVVLIKNFLALYRESDVTLLALREKLASTQDSRGNAFLDMFEFVYDQYVTHLKSEGAIDFSDMIREAAKGLRSGKASLELDYLLVDEFQDISHGRADLLKAILEQNPDCRLFAVGDDWQSIYRFAGSDVQVMVGFADRFGFTERNDLRQTQRFGSYLLAATSAFIQRNPQQLKKDLRAARVDRLPAIEIVSVESASRSVLTQAAMAGLIAGPLSSDEEVQYEVPSESGNPVDEDTASTRALKQILHRISEEQDGAKVLVLGRYNFLEKRMRVLDQLPTDIQIKFSTVHRAKGLEADYVVVLDVVTGRYGFPSEIEDDPIMNLVLSMEEGIPNAEERRLFYVALTRAKKKSYVITSDHHRSAFVDELEGESFRGLVIPSEAKSRVANCPICKGSTLRHLVSKFGEFFACSSERCPGKALKCPHCGNGGLVRKGELFTCLFCKKSVDSCPNCERGYLKHIDAGVSKFGKSFDAFDACSTNQKDPFYKCYARPCKCNWPMLKREVNSSTILTNKESYNSVSVKKNDKITIDNSTNIKLPIQTNLSIPKTKKIEVQSNQSNNHNFNSESINSSFSLQPDPIALEKSQNSNLIACPTIANLSEQETIANTIIVDVGDRLRHPIFGPGFVKSIMQTTVEVFFPGSGKTEVVSLENYDWDSTNAFLEHTGANPRPRANPSAPVAETQESGKFETCSLCGGSGGVKESYGSRESGYCSACSGKGWID